jgi:hypothetical protein
MLVSDRARGIQRAYEHQNPSRLVLGSIAEQTLVIAHPQPA